MGRIRGNDDDALKFTSAEIWMFRTGETSFRENAKNADSGDWESFFGNFMRAIEAPATKVHGLISVIRKIRQASLNADFSNKLSTTLHRRLGNTKSEEFFLGGGADSI